MVGKEGMIEWLGRRGLWNGWKGGDDGMNGKMW